MLFCEYCKIIKNHFFSRTPPVAAFVDYLQHWLTHSMPQISLVTCSFLMFLEGIVVYGMKLVETNCIRVLYWLPTWRYLFKIHSRNTRTMCEICSKLIIKTTERRHRRLYIVFIVNFEHISHIVLVFLLLTLNK